jgi:hypothetical protein
MRRTSVFGLALLSWIAIPFTPACAQSTPRTQNGLVTSGIRASLSIASVANTFITVQYNLENITNGRQYVMLNRNNSDGALSNGTTLRMLPGSVGISDCPLTEPSECFKRIKADSSIEPHEFITITVRYQASEPISDTTTATFPLKLAVRTTPPHPQGEAIVAEQEPGPPHLVRFNFPPIPLP